MNTKTIMRHLEHAECKVLEGQKCFIVPWTDFQEIYEQLAGNVFTSDALTRKTHLENFELKLSSLEEGHYYVCAKSQPVLDQLWELKHKGDS